jgi:hypothetical protein
MITTNTDFEGNFYVTAKAPAGPWSDPVFIEARGIDPDLFFDDDGKANEEAGMILLNNGAHFDLLIKQSGGKRVLVTKLRFGSYKGHFKVFKLGDCWRVHRSLCWPLRYR